MAREHSAAQCSAPRRTAPHRRRATSDPTREIARLAASLRIAASRIARLRSMLQQQRRQQADGQQQHNHGHQPAHPEAPSTPRQPPADIAQPKHPNARQRRSARRAAQWWQNQQKCSSLEKNLSSPQPARISRTTDEASPTFATTMPHADSAAPDDSNRQHIVSAVRENIPQPAAAMQPQPQPSPPMQPEQQLPPAVPPAPPTLSDAPVDDAPAARLPEPTGDGKRRAIEAPPGVVLRSGAAPAVGERK